MGKWWGRKPLVLCRATILGVLLPVTDNPEKDREVFLRLMTMDDDGMLRRKSINIPPSGLFNRLPPADRNATLRPDSTEDQARSSAVYRSRRKRNLQKRVFLSLSYDERLKYCDRPEQIESRPFAPNSWKVINHHLGTNVYHYRNW